MTDPVLNDRFFDELASSVTAIDVAETLPPACYTDAAFYEFEKEALFNHEWLCLGREEQVKANGDYFTTKIIGEPLVIVRDRSGTVRAQLRVPAPRHAGGRGRGEYARFRLPLSPLDL
jgi:hypothetical protein